MPLDTLTKLDATATLKTVSGSVFAPCSGRDLPLLLELFGNSTDRLIACDLSYIGRRASAAYAVPKDWKRVSSLSGREQDQPEKITWYNGRRPFQPEATIEVWRRPNGSELTIELRRDLAQDVLIDRFTPGSISAFLHHRDGTGEGGSGLWFLEHSSRGGDPEDRSLKLLETLAPKLADGALIITDGVLAMPEFSYGSTFEAADIQWTPIATVHNENNCRRPSVVWRAKRLVVLPCD